MFAGHKARALARAALLLLAALAPASHAAAQSPAEQSDPPRRQQGPVAGPAIKLPRGAGADDARAQTPGAREEASEVSRAVPQRWEYCYIKGFKYTQKGLSLSLRTPAAVVRYLPSGSDEIEGASEEEALGNAFAKLGEDGWELAGIRTDFSLNDGTGSSSALYFFKRPKRQE